MGEMGKIQKALFIIFATLIISLGVYILYFSNQNRELINSLLFKSK
jgi:cell division protein FtsL